MLKLYAVRADYLGFCEFAGHWRAETPTKAIEVAKAYMMKSNPVEAQKTYEWHARISKAKPENVLIRD